MKSGISWLLASLAPVVCIATPQAGLLRLPDDWIPYVERVQPEEIFLIEKQLGEPLSEKSDVVIYQCDGEGRIWLAYSLRSEDRDYRLEMEVFAEDSGGRNRQASRLPRDVAERLIAGFEFMLTKQVYPMALPENTVSRRKGESSVVWIHLCVSKSRTALGKVLVPVARCWVGLPDSNRPFFDILYLMRRCMDRREVGEESPITKLDIAIGNLRLSYPK